METQDKMDLSQMLAMRAQFQQMLDIVAPYSRVGPVYDASKVVGLVEGQFNRGVFYSEVKLNAATVEYAIQAIIWRIDHFLKSINCPFPKGSRAGLIHEDLGKQTGEKEVGA